MGYGFPKMDDCAPERTTWCTSFCFVLFCGLSKRRRRRTRGWGGGCGSQIVLMLFSSPRTARTSSIECVTIIDETGERKRLPKKAKEGKECSWTRFIAEQAISGPVTFLPVLVGNAKRLLCTSERNLQTVNKRSRKPSCFKLEWEDREKGEKLNVFTLRWIKEREASWGCFISLFAWMVFYCTLYFSFAFFCSSVLTFPPSFSISIPFQE